MDYRLAINWAQEALREADSLAAIAPMKDHEIAVVDVFLKIAKVEMTMQEAILEATLEQTAVMRELMDKIAGL